jgi:hypothetical protein
MPLDFFVTSRECMDLMTTDSLGVRLTEISSTSDAILPFGFIADALHGRCVVIKILDSTYFEQEVQDRLGIDTRD